MRKRSGSLTAIEQMKLVPYLEHDMRHGSAAKRATTLCASFRHETSSMRYLLAFLLVLPLSGCELLPVALKGPASKNLVCHKSKKTLELPREAISAHLGHGDYRGPCR
jgi:hypothetical protein